MQKSESKDKLYLVEKKETGGTEPEPESMKTSDTGKNNQKGVTLQAKKNSVQSRYMSNL